MLTIKTFIKSILILYFFVVLQISLLIASYIIRLHETKTRKYDTSYKQSLEYSRDISTRTRQKEFGLSEIATAVELNAGTCANILKTLVYRNYVEQSGTKKDTS